MRRRCPSCGYTRAWELADGRFKCRRCGNRYRWQPLWHASRLDARTKNRLLDYFALGVPVRRVGGNGRASLPAIERFYRLARTGMVLHEIRAGNLIPSSRPEFRPRDGYVMVFLRTGEEAMVMELPDADEAEHALAQMELPTGKGGLFGVNETLAYAAFPVKAHRVILRAERGGARGGTVSGPIGGLWSYCLDWLYPRNSVPVRFFPLYMGEILYRYNYRSNNLNSMILKDMKRFTVEQAHLYGIQFD